MNWRPENWENPNYNGMVGWPQTFDAFEAGADAMLETLKKLPTSAYGDLLEALIDCGEEYSDIAGDNYLRKGWLVFIPDDDNPDIQEKNE